MKDFVERTEELFKLMNRAKEENSDSYILYRNEIVELNLRLVAHVLKKYRPYTDDQYQAGCMGLIAAVDTYNKDTEVPFPNYACFCIEREIHKMYRHEKKLIENILASQMIYLDEVKYRDNEDNLDPHEMIPDILAEEELERLLEENDLTKFFETIIIPSIEEVAGNTKGQKTKVDLPKWINLEIQLFLELAEIDSQKARFNMTQMAKIVGLSLQRVRGRHQQVIEKIKKRCKELGFDVN